MSHAALEEKLAQRAKDFELGALLSLLQAKFPERALRFRSHPSMAPGASPVESVEFHPDEVVVTLNAGLFSSTTPLPSYFYEWISGSHPLPGFEAILGVLDDHLLRDRAESAAVENSRRLFGDFSKFTRQAFELARPASAGTLRWVFAKVFPELGVSLSRAGVERSFAIDELRLGHARLGHTAMGGEAELRLPGYDVFLSTGESTTWAGEPWPLEAKRRLEARVFPALEATPVHLRIFLFDFEGGLRLSLVKNSTFGFDALMSAVRPHVVVLYEGRAPSRHGV